MARPVTGGSQTFSLYSQTRLQPAVVSKETCQEEGFLPPGLKNTVVLITIFKYFKHHTYNSS